jgi:glyoxylase-like metal-dependent hydrolase (beta-lactamase superfamily II)
VAALAAALGGRPLARVIVTHGHPDHASGVPAIRARWPGVELYRWLCDDEADCRPLADGQSIDAGDRRLQVVYTPGHATDHVCLWDAVRRDLYAGDMVIRGGSVLIPAGRGGSLREYLRSLERLVALDPARIYPGHGPIIEAPADVLAEHLAHRRDRERQVLACIETGSPDVDRIVSRLYPSLAEGLLPAARMTVQAHLDKLREDGRIR